MISNEAVKAFKDVFHGETPMSYDETIKAALLAAFRTLPPSPSIMVQSYDIALMRKQAFNAGYVLACCNIVNLHDEPVIAYDTLSELGVSRDEVTAMNLAEYDIEALSKIEQSKTESPYSAKRSLTAEPAQEEQLPQDVINLVIAAREAFDTGIFQGDEEFNLDTALEPFAERVPYSNEPDHVAPPSEIGK